MVLHGKGQKDRVVTPPRAVHETRGEPVRPLKVPQQRFDLPAIQDHRQAPVPVVTHRFLNILIHYRGWVVAHKDDYSRH